MNIIQLGEYWENLEQEIKLAIENLIQSNELLASQKFTYQEVFLEEDFTRLERIKNVCTDNAKRQFFNSYEEEGPEEWFGWYLRNIRYQIFGEMGSLDCSTLPNTKDEDEIYVGHPFEDHPFKWSFRNSLIGHTIAEGFISVFEKELKQTNFHHHLLEGYSMQLVLKWINSIDIQNYNDTQLAYLLAFIDENVLRKDQGLSMLERKLLFIRTFGLRRVGDSLMRRNLQADWSRTTQMKIKKLVSKKPLTPSSC